MKTEEDLEFMSGLEPVSSVGSSEFSDMEKMKEKEQHKTREEEEVPVDETSFAPNRILYILPNNLFSKEIKIIDVTSGLRDGVVPPYAGDAVDDALRERARELATAADADPLYTIKRPHWYSTQSTMYLVGSSATATTSWDEKGEKEEQQAATEKSSSRGAPHTELCYWKQSALSCGRADLTFPPGSPHCAHALALTHPQWYRRTNVWAQDSVPHDWTCDGRLRSNRMTLHRLTAADAGGVGPVGRRRRAVVARYAQRWGSWVTGGVLLVDTAHVDEVVAVQTAVVMLRRMQQRAMESAKYCGGPGAGCAGR